MLACLGISLALDLLLFVGFPTLLSSLGHLAGYAYEYTRLIFTTAIQVADLQEGEIVDEDIIKITDLVFIKDGGINGDSEVLIQSQS